MSAKGHGSPIYHPRRRAENLAQETDAVRRDVEPEARQPLSQRFVVQELLGKKSTPLEAAWNAQKHAWNRRPKAGVVFVGRQPSQGFSGREISSKSGLDGRESIEPEVP
jgi:hypothetical protein